ncbi:MAG: hypothetical protein AAF732_21655 [Pseudomonadota bacterium]
MATKNDIGKRIYVAAAVPATNDAAGFEALTWVWARYHVTLPQLAMTHNEIEIPDMEEGFNQTVKGAASGVPTTMDFRIDDGDRANPGQVVVKTQAIDEDGILSVKIVDGSGVNGAPATGDLVQYAQGITHSFQLNQGTTDSYEGFQATFKPNQRPVDATEPSA